MDPDSEAGFTTSQILKNGLITLVFSSCNYYKTELSSSPPQLAQVKPVVSTEQVKPVKKPVKKKKPRTIYITFDDGPNKGTRNMMDIIKDEEVPVTLFMVGQHVYSSKEQAAVFDSIINCKYFEIANHSFTHAFGNKYAKFYTIPDSAAKDFLRCADSLKLTSNIIRLPGRNIWRTAGISSTDISKCKAAADSLHEKGYTEVGWDIEWHYDASMKLKNTSDELLQQIDSMFVNCKTKTPDHLVLLAHDQVYAKSTDSAELRQFIKKLKATNEYNFEIVSQYPDLKKSN